jgi:6,7-dimethyl-8-ribityllumazine synthase
VAILASRYNELITTRLLEGALACCREAGIAREAVDVVWVPGAFELPVAAAAAAGTKRYACLVALGAVIRGDTPHSTTSPARRPAASTPSPWRMHCRSASAC